MADQHPFARHWNHNSHYYPRIAELLQQMHGAFRTDARSHLKGNILDGHGREWNDVFFDG